MTPIGAIVGGVIGGIASVALISTLVIILLRRGRKAKQISAYSQANQSPDHKLQLQHRRQEDLFELPSHENGFASELSNEGPLPELAGPN